MTHNKNILIDECLLMHTVDVPTRHSQILHQSRLDEIINRHSNITRHDHAQRVCQLATGLWP